jgi:hypothetical protein
MDWAAWGPTIVALATCVYFAGILRNRQDTSAKRLDAHDKQLDDHTKDLTSHSVKIGMLEAWRDGWSAARTVYDKTPKES